jgi:hypothetical protein
MAELERYVDTPRIAEIMGVSERTIKRWVKEGMPSETWGMHCRRFLPSEVIAWASVRNEGMIRLVNQPARRANVAPGSNHHEV